MPPLPAKPSRSPVTYGKEPLRTGAILILILAGIATSPGAGPPVRLQEQETALQARLAGKIMTLRHFYSDPAMTFTPDGLLAGAATEGAWTLHGLVEIERVRLHQDRLSLRGQRLYLAYNPGTGNFDRFRSRDRVDITIRRSPSDGGDRLNTALDRVFLKPGEALADVVPDYWRLFLLHADPPGYTPADPTQPTAPEGFDPPRLLDKVGFTYSDEAIHAGVTGTSVLLVRVAADGAPTVVKILKPLGYGLDDSVAAGIRRCRCEPARRGSETAESWLPVTAEFTMTLPGAQKPR
jgi:TonB family protein